jgi:hypothetical protein
MIIKTVKIKKVKHRSDRKRSFEAKMLKIERDRKRKEKYSQG